MRCFIILFVMCTFLLQPYHELVAADLKKPKAIQVEKDAKGDRISITGRIKSSHLRFRLGRSVRAYSIVTKDGLKVKLPRSHTEHRDGSVTGIDFRTMKGREVVVTCSGRVKAEGEKILSVTIKKVYSVTLVLPPKPPSLFERYGKKPEPEKP
jgi:hypothetical protein